MDVEIHFPLCGIDRSRGFERQPVRQTMAGKYARTTPLGINVRAYDAILNRYRGGSRPGLSKTFKAQVNGKRLVQGMGLLAGTGYTAPGGGVQSSQSGRVVTRVYVSGGTIKVADAGATSYTTPTNGSGALNSSGLVFMSPLNQKMYFADGVNWKYYDPATNTVSAWTETAAGDLPEDSDGNPPRLIETWHGCIVLAGWVKDAQNIVLSAVGDAHDFDFSPLSPSQTDAVTLAASDLGTIGDMVTGLVPFNDDILFIGGDHTLWMLRGHPLAGGRLDRISDTVGMAWGRAWCKDPHGAIYFVSNQMGIYRVAPGGLPQRISQQIEQLLLDVNTGAKTISLAWNDRFQGLHVFMTTTAAATASDIHFFFEARTGAWWMDVLGHKNFNPLCTMVVDGNLPDDRHVEIGSWDGYVRYLDHEAAKDDGYDISSEVWFGPLLTKDSEELHVMEAQAIMAEDSGIVDYSVFVGKTAEQAFSSTTVLDGTWGPGRNHSDMIRRAGHAVYVRVTSDNQWASELVRFALRGTGAVRRRGA